MGSISIGGPYNAKGIGETPSRRKIFECRPSSAQEEEPCARKILSTLARRAYRRPLTEDDIQTLLDFYKAGRDEGGFEAGIGSALERILVGPEFLFRIEVDPKNVASSTAYPISDLELASRLSFFLWSSIPDDQLLDLAEGGKLQDPLVLEQQVRRFLKDSRSKALVSNFAAQWLQLRSLRAINPDQKCFPILRRTCGEAFRLETELFFESLLREDRSVLELLSADYTFLNERLARHYGIPDVYGSHFRRVELKTEERRGLLGKGSILAVTSYANRTSPVLRGKWVLENLLGTHLLHHHPISPIWWKATRMVKHSRCARPWNNTVPILLAQLATTSWTRWALRWKTSTGSVPGEPPMPVTPSILQGYCPTAPRFEAQRSFKGCSWKAKVKSLLPPLRKDS